MGWEKLDGRGGQCSSLVFTTFASPSQHDFDLAQVSFEPSKFLSLISNGVSNIGTCRELYTAGRHQCIVANEIHVAYHLSKSSHVGQERSRWDYISEGFGEQVVSHQFFGSGKELSKQLYCNCLVQLCDVSRSVVPCD